MGGFKKPLVKKPRLRLDLRAEHKKPELFELAAEAALEFGHAGLSDYVRQAIEEKLRRDGYELPWENGEAK